MAADPSKGHVLITGATGFIGAHVLRHLQEQGWKVSGTSRKATQKANMFPIDVTDYAVLSKFVQKNDITHCIHLAGESLVESGQSHPYETFQSNITGALNVLECARKHGVEKTIIVSSSHVYGKQVAPCSEEDIPLPSRPYETSKLATDIIAQSYATTYDMDVLIPRFVNVYGPGDRNMTRLVPTVFTTLLKGENPNIWGGTAVRDYLYIDDVLNAFDVLLSTRLPKGTQPIINFGSGTHSTVNSVVKKMVEIARPGAHIEYENESARTNEITRQYVKSDKARELLGWEAKTELDTGLRLAYTWYSEYYSRQQSKNTGVR